MERPRQRQRPGLLAFAFDAPGREILHALARRPDLDRALVLCHHAAAGPGRDATSPIWFRRTPGHDWDEPAWGHGLDQLAAGFEAAVCDALDAHRWRSERGGIDLVDLLLLAPVSSSDGVTLPEGTLPGLRSIRNRYGRVSRVMLMIERRFEKVGRAGVPGKVSPLPFSDGRDDGVFDLVLVLDRINLDGMVLNDDTEATEQAAAAIAHLTVGELYATLFEHLQKESARLDAGGRYFSLGVAEWRLEPDRMEAATRELLFERTAKLLTSEMGTEAAGSEVPSGDDETHGCESPGDLRPQKQETEIDEDGALPDDSWLRGLQQAVAELTPQDEKQRLEKLRNRGFESLSDLLMDNVWSLSLLQRLLARRRKKLEEIRRRAVTELVQFMPVFSRWYVTVRAGLRSEATTSETALVEYEDQILDKRRLAWFIIVLVLALGAWSAARSYDYPLGLNVLTGVLALAVVILLIIGFQKVVKKTKEVAVGPPRDLKGEMLEKRARVRAAAELLEWNNKTAERLARSLEDLRHTAEQAAAKQPVFPYSREVCSAILGHGSLTTDVWLERFWSTRGPAILAGLARGGASLAAALEDFAAESCRGFKDVGWAQVLQALGGADSLSKPMWRHALIEARDVAVPRMPVAGKFSYNFLALPRRLPEPMKEALSQQFPEQKVKVEIEGEAVLVVRVTQGYE